MTEVEQIETGTMPHGARLTADGRALFSVNMMDDELVYQHRNRALNPDNPFIRGTAQNPDVYFQGRETVNPYYNATPGIVQKTMDRFGEITGRHYGLFDYHGDPQAERRHRERKARANHAAAGDNDVVVP